MHVFPLRLNKATLCLLASAFTLFASVLLGVYLVPRFLHVCAFRGVISLLKMALKPSSEVLASTMCLVEEIQGR